MTDNIPQAPQGEFVLFTSTDGQTRVECRFESDTLWLSQAAMAELYQVMLAGVKVLNKVIELGMPLRQPLN